MIITSTNNIEGREVSEYIGLVFGEVVEGMNFMKDLGAGFRNFVGGRSHGYEDSIINGRREALSEMIARAEKIEADAIIAIKFDYEAIVEGMLMITVCGSAVKLK